MKNKHQVHNLIILDESGSMSSIKSLIVSGFNELVQTIHGVKSQFPEQEHTVSFVTFNGFGNKLLHFMEPIEKLHQIDSDKYQPDATTPLYDAMGFSFNKLRQALDKQTDYNVLVTILTDGEENASKEYAGSDIRKLVDELSAVNWTFTYIGTGHDVSTAAANLSIHNTFSFDKDVEGINQMFVEEKEARMMYYKKIHLSESPVSGYFGNKEKNVQED